MSYDMNSSIFSLSYRAYLHVLSYDVASPTGSQKIYVKNAFSECFIDKLGSPASDTYTAVAIRVVAVVAIALFVAPVGFLLNGAQVAYHFVCYQWADKGMKDEALSKVKLYANACFADFNFLAIVYAPVVVTNNRLSLTVRALASRFALNAGIYIPAAADLSRMFPGLVDISYKRAVGLKKFGVIGEAGHLVWLTDEAYMQHAQRFDVDLSNLETEMIRMVQWVQKELPASHKLTNSLSWIEQEGIINHVENSKKEVTEGQAELFSRWLQLYQKKVNQWNKCILLLNQYFWIQKGCPSLDQVQTFNFPIRPSSDIYNILRCEDFNSAWNNVLANAQSKLEEEDLSLPNSTIPETYNKLRKMIREGKRPMDFFVTTTLSGYPVTADEINKRKAKLYLCCHPDKAAIINRPGEANAIREVLNKASEMIDLDFGVGKPESDHDCIHRNLEPGETAPLVPGNEQILKRYNELKLIARQHNGFYILSVNANDLKSLNPKLIQPLVDVKYHKEVNFLYRLGQLRFRHLALNSQNQHQLDEWNRIREVIEVDHSFLYADLYVGSNEQMSDIAWVHKRRQEILAAIRPDILIPLLHQEYHGEVMRLYNFLKDLFAEHPVS